MALCKERSDEVRSRKYDEFCLGQFWRIAVWYEVDEVEVAMNLRK